MDRVQLTQNFFLDEFCRSQTAARMGRAVEIEVGSDYHQRLKLLCELILQPLRDALGPVTVTSGFRPLWLNALVGGSPTSSHPEALAADIVVAGHAPHQVAAWIAENIDEDVRDQLILEFDEWVHVSIAMPGEPARGEVLTARHSTGGTSYVNGLHSSGATEVA